MERIRKGVSSERAVFGPCYRKVPPPRNSGSRVIDGADDGDNSTYEIRGFSLTAMLEDGPALLAFYPGDFTPVCPEELCSLRD